MASTARSRTATPSTSGPARRAASPSFAVDTQRYPFHDGLNTLQVCAADLADRLVAEPHLPPEDAADDRGRQLVRVVRRRRRRPDLARVRGRRGRGDRARLASGRDRGRPAHRRARQRRGGGAAVCQRADDAAGMGAWPTAVVQTGPDGSFSYEVQPGPSREIGFRYRHDREQISATAASAHARSRRWSCRAGGSATAARSASSAPSPAPRPPAAWSSSRPAGRGGGAGTRSAAPRPTPRAASPPATASATRPRRPHIRIRAVAPEQAGYPYLEGRSNARRVRVIGSG